MLMERVGSDSQKHFCIVLGEESRLDSQPCRLWIFWIPLHGGGCAVYCRVLYLLDAACTSLAVKTKDISKHYQKSGVGRVEQNSPLLRPTGPVRVPVSKRALCQVNKNISQSLGPQGALGKLNDDL